MSQEHGRDFMVGEGSNNSVLFPPSVVSDLFYTGKVFSGLSERLGLGGNVI